MAMAFDLLDGAMTSRPPKHHQDRTQHGAFVGAALKCNVAIVSIFVVSDSDGLELVAASSAFWCTHLVLRSQACQLW